MNRVISCWGKKSGSRAALHFLNLLRKAICATKQLSNRARSFGWPFEEESAQLAINKNQIFIPKVPSAKCRQKGKSWTLHCHICLEPRPKRGEFLKSFGGIRRVFAASRKGWTETDHKEKTIKPKGNESIYAAAHRCLIMSARVWWRWNRCAKTLAEIPKRILLPRRSRYHVVAFAFLVFWLLWMMLWFIALYEPDLSSTPMLCLTLWPLAGSLRVMSFRGGSSSRGQRQLGNKMLQSNWAFFVVVVFLIHQSLSKGTLGGSGAAQRQKGPRGVPYYQRFYCGEREARGL